VDIDSKSSPDFSSPPVLGKEGYGFYPPLTAEVAAVPQSSPALAVLLFLLTLVSTTLAGTSYYIGFLVMAGSDKEVPILRALWGGFPYAFAIMAILLAHELGHYLACRYYRLSATYPYFIPLPIFSIAGTMGAFIRIRSPFQNARQLFDVGIAGPLAGYIFSLPALILGLAASNINDIPTNTEGTVFFGEPLIFKAVAQFFFHYDETVSSLNLHPIGWAAWFGIFATSINLIPIGQLDGGHIVYSLFGPVWHRRCSIACCLGLVSISVISWSPAYLVFAVLVFILGLRHPHTWEEDRIVDSKRKWLAVIALIIFIFSFVPVPVSFAE